MENDEGALLPGFSWNEDTGCLTLAYPREITHVFVYDQTGNCLHLLLNPS